MSQQGQQHLKLLRPRQGTVGLRLLARPQIGPRSKRTALGLEQAKGTCTSLANLRQAPSARTGPKVMPGTGKVTFSLHCERSDYGPEQPTIWLHDEEANRKQ